MPTQAPTRLRSLARSLRTYAPSQVETPREPWGPVFLLVFLVGAGLAHTAFGLDSFGIRGGGALLALSQVLRVGADVAMSQYSADHSRYVDWVVLMRGDLCWLGVMFGIRGAVAYLSASGSAVTNSRDADAALAALCRGPPPDEKRGLPMAPELSRAPLATRAVRVGELPTTSWPRLATRGVRVGEPPTTS